MYKFKLIFFFIASFFCMKTINAEIKGKIDAGPAFVHLDILESDRTVKTMDLVAVKVDGTLVLHEGLCLKPNILYGANNGSLFVTGLGLGYILPINETWTVTPSIGMTYTHVKTTINIPFLNLFHLKEKFHSKSAYVCLEGTYNINACWRVNASYQYAWSRSMTKITALPDTNSKTQGPSYALQLEKDLNKFWSVNIGVAYNLSLTKEKHGLRAYGTKIGIAHWF